MLEADVYRGACEIIKITVFTHCFAFFKRPGNELNPLVNLSLLGVVVRGVRYSILIDSESINNQA